MAERTGPEAARLAFYDLATLNAVHDFYVFVAKSDAHFDRWLVEQILRARLQREVTARERKIHGLNPTKEV